MNTETRKKGQPQLEGKISDPESHKNWSQFQSRNCRSRIAKI